MLLGVLKVVSLIPNICTFYLLFCMHMYQYILVYTWYVWLYTQYVFFFQRNDLVCTHLLQVQVWYILCYSMVPLYTNISRNNVVYTLIYQHVPTCTTRQDSSNFIFFQNQVVYTRWPSEIANSVDSIWH
jgi:hypothetical protein